MDWSNERYVRIYVRETVGDVALTWQGRAIWREILIKCDRAGLISLDGHGVRGLAGLIRMPPEMVEEHFQQILDDGRVQIRGDYLVVPNYIEAQEATQSDAQRQRECRARRRDKAMLGELDKMSQNVNAQCDNESQNATKCRGVVTNGHSVPYRTVPSRTHNKNSALARDQKQKRSTKTTRGTQIPDTWKPVDHGSLADHYRLDLDAEAAKFRDHALATGRVLKDWNAGFRNWLRKAAEFKRDGSSGKKKTQHERNLEILGLSEEDDGQREGSGPVSCDDIRVVPR